MDKSQHTITVPREYLEYLEKFYDENKQSTNSFLSCKKVSDARYALFLETPTGFSLAQDINELYLVDKNGKQLQRFIRPY